MQEIKCVSIALNEPFHSLEIFWCRDAEVLPMDGIYTMIGQLSDIMRKTSIVPNEFDKGTVMTLT